jgi:hypothetical protein
MKVLLHKELIKKEIKMKTGQMGIITQENLLLALPIRS